MRLRRRSCRGVRAERTKHPPLPPSRGRGGGGGGGGQKLRAVYSPEAGPQTTRGISYVAEKFEDGPFRSPKWTRCKCRCKPPAATGSPPHS